MTTFFLIRHATTDSVGKRLSGRMPGVPLNAEGQEQAQKLAQRLEKLQITAIYSSPLERTIQTSEPLAKLLQLPYEVKEDFMEMDFGDWTNKTFEELKQLPQFHNFNVFRSATRVPGGEMMLEAQTRMVAGLQALCAKHTNQTVAVVSHADLIKAAVAYYAGIPLDLFQRIEISPASVSIIQVYEETARIMMVNNTGEFKI